MSTDATDTTSSVSEAVESSEATESEHNETVEVDKKDLEGLAGLLESFRTTLLGHEARLLEHEGILAKLLNMKPTKLEIPRGRSR